MDDHFFGDDRGYRWALHAIAFSIDATCACNQTDSSICCSPGNQRCSLLPGPTPTPPTFIFEAFVRTFLLPLPEFPSHSNSTLCQSVRAYIPFRFSNFFCISYLHLYTCVYPRIREIQLFEIEQKDKRLRITLAKRSIETSRLNIEYSQTISNGRRYHGRKDWIDSPPN